MEILDSGDRTLFDSGAVRDMHEGKGRCDLLPMREISCYMFKETAGVSSGIFDCIYNFQKTGGYSYLYDAIAVFTDAHYGDCYSMLLELAKHFEEGAKKYGDNNWRKGIPVNVYIDSGVRHLLKFMRGDTDEPHDKAFCWNMFCAIWTCVNLPELNPYRNEEAE